MSNRIGPSVRGARAAQELLLRIERACERSIASTGELDPVEIAKLLEAALSDASLLPGFMLALGEALGMAVTGSPIDPRRWTPLEHFWPSEKDAPLRFPAPR